MSSHAVAGTPGSFTLRRWLAWIGYALLLVVAPWLFTSTASLSYLSQLGTVIIFCLSYNMLMGQGGMLSFGHAVYSGLGAYFAIHTMNWASQGLFKVPLPLIPLIGGVAGMAFGILFGYVTTKKAGTTFAMITLGLGELVHACAQMFPGFFGGEGGITTNRTDGGPFLGLSFGPQIQVYYLIVAWVLVCTVLMYAFTQTPLGRIANAVRDNPERAEFVGYDTRRVRYLVLILAAFFAGISGGLAAINFEIVGTEGVSSARSGDALLYTFIGGTTAFVGPIIGAVVGSFLTVKLSDYTMAWQLYLGVFFVLFVIYAPAGLTGIIAANWRVLRAGRFGRVARGWCAVVGASLVTLAGTIVLVELGYALTFGAQKAAAVKFIAALDSTAIAGLFAAGALLLLGGCFWLSRARGRFRQDWDRVNAELHTETPANTEVAQ